MFAADLLLLAAPVEFRCKPEVDQFSTRLGGCCCARRQRRTVSIGANKRRRGDLKDSCRPLEVSTGDRRWPSDRGAGEIFQRPVGGGAAKNTTTMGEAAEQLNFNSNETSGDEQQKRFASQPEQHKSQSTVKTPEVAGRQLHKTSASAVSVSVSLSSATSICLPTWSPASRMLPLQLALIMALIVVSPPLLDTDKSPVRGAAALERASTGRDASGTSRAQHEHLIISHHRAPSSTFILSPSDNKQNDEEGKSPTHSNEPLATETTEDSFQKVSKSSEQQQQQQQQAFSLSTNHNDSPREAGDSDRDSEVVALRRFRRGVQLQQHEQPLGCLQQAAFWNFLKGSYPSLASHLFALAATKGDDRILEQTVRSVGRLLEEAERLLREQLIARGFVNPAHKSTFKPIITSAWLAKVTANPIYNKMVQRFQMQHRQALERQQQQQRPHEAAHKSPIQSRPSPNGGDNTAQQQQSDSHVYGRVIHYPHEANRQATRPLEKLRQLNLLNQDPQTNEIEPSLGGQPEEPEQSNRIPLMTSGVADGDGEPWPIHRSSGRHESDATDSARNKFVYGNVVLRPNQKSQEQRAHNPVAALKQLTKDLERGVDSSEYYQMRHPAHRGEATSESYGRIIASPPPNGRNSGEEHLVRVDENTDRWPIEAGSSHSEGATHEGGSSSSTSLGKDTDEIVTQQRGGSMAAHQDGSSEFEGVWYSGPLQQIEVRQVRSEERAKGAPEEIVVHTTSSPKDTFLVQ